MKVKAELIAQSFAAMEGNKVFIIKWVRYLTGLGLMEAKETIDSLYVTGGPVEIVIDSKELDIVNKRAGTEFSEEYIIKELDRKGVIVSKSRKSTTIQDQLKTAAVVAVEEGDYEMAVKILNILING